MQSILVRAIVKNLVLALIKDSCSHISHGHTYLCMSVSMSANGMNLGLCVPRILLKGTIKNVIRLFHNNG